MSVNAVETATAEQVWELLEPLLKPGKPTRVAVERSIGCVLSEDVRARLDYPPFTRAVMDGYAVRAADFSAGRAVLQGMGLAKAGRAPETELGPGQCLQINTGAPLPPGADAVVATEKSRRLDAERVELDGPASAGQNVQERASLLREGDLVVRAGTRIEPGTIAALVAGGVRDLLVFHPPRVGLVTSGDEIVAPDRQLAAGQIPDSNRYVIEALIQRANAEPVILGAGPDEPHQLRAMLELGLHNDLLCVVGGMSKGTHDLVPGLLEQLGVRWVVKSLHLKPGKPTRIGRGPNGCWVIGLPGNPVSAAVCYLLFARPIIDALQGLGLRRPPMLKGELDTGLGGNGDRPMFHPSVWSVDRSGRVRLSPLEWRGSGDPFGLAVANALLHRPAGAPAAQAGEHVDFIPFDLPQ